MSFDLFNRRTHRPHRQLAEFLADHADALLGDSVDLDRLIAPYDRIAIDQVEGLVAVAERLSRSLVDVKPSDLFVEHLRQQLLYGQEPERRTWWQRLRRLPPRTQLAAGIGGATLTAGVVLIASRPFVIDALTSWRER